MSFYRSNILSLFRKMTFIFARFDDFCRENMGKNVVFLPITLPKSGIPKSAT